MNAGDCLAIDRSAFGPWRQGCTCTGQGGYGGPVQRGFFRAGMELAITFFFVRPCAVVVFVYFQSRCHSIMASWHDIMGMDQYLLIPFLGE